MGLFDFTFYDLIQRNAQCFHNRPAWYDADSQRLITFAEYKEKVDQLAKGLQQAGIKKGDRIGVFGKNSLEYFLLYGASAALGAIVLPINWRLSAKEVVYNLNDAKPFLLFVDAEFQELIENSKETLQSVKAYFNLTPAAGGFLEFESLMERGGDFKPVEICDQDGFIIIHTAAVAGSPRGALLSHRNMICSNIHLSQSMQIQTDDVHLNLLPLFHVGGLFMATMSFHAGALNINMSKFDSVQAAQLIEDKSVSVIFDFSPVLSSIMKAHETHRIRIQSLRAVAGIDIPDTIERYQAMTGGTFYCVYGQTEVSGFATLGRYNERPGSAGRMLPLNRVRLVDDNDRTVSVGEIGEITVRGPNVFLGYWNLPEDTAQAFRGGWHHTGDLGRFDSDGFLWYEGRKAEKELIKPGGENVYPVEVERVLLEHPSIEKAVVFGVPDPKWNEGIKAVCQLKAGESLEAEAVIRFVGERIASFKKPQYVEFASDLPLLPDGSPDRVQIKKRYGAR
ncbi:MAG: AMP-binding protein [Deltaproteobacteria bacterium]|nr:AMP-binding protein [Deltaproteobacteria bacterium]